MLELKLKTVDWDVRVNQTLLGMCIVDAFLLAQGCWEKKVDPRDFYSRLAEELIDNKYGQMRLQRGRKRTQAEMVPESPRIQHGVVPPELQLSAPTPTKRTKMGNSKHLLQGKCMVCSKLTTWVCRVCRNMYPPHEKKQFLICNKAKKVCMGKHLCKMHPEKIANYVS